MSLTPPPGTVVDQSGMESTDRRIPVVDHKNLSRDTLMTPDIHGRDTRDPLLAEIHALHSIVAALPVIEQAKGTIMLSHGLTADAAFDVLRGYSEHYDISIRDLAVGLLTAVAGPTSTPDSRGRMDALLTDLAARVGLRDDDCTNTDDADPNH